VAVDLASGDRTVVQGNLPRPQDLAFDAAGGRVLVVDSVLDTLSSISLAGGGRVTISGASLGGGPALANPRDLVLDQDRVLVSDFTLGVFAIDGSDRILLSGEAAGTGPSFFIPLGLALDSPNQRVLVTDTGLSAILAADLSSGDRTVVSDSTVGAGIALLAPARAVLGESRTHALVLDFGSLLRVELASGDRSVVSGAMTIPRDLDLVSGGANALVVDSGTRSLLVVDLSDGSRIEVTGSGPGLQEPAGVVFDAAKGRAFIVDTGLDALLAVDLPFGDRTLVDGAGPPLVSPDGVAFDAGTGTVLVVDSGLGALLAVEPESGDRVIVSK
ncbi:MAG: hypothetical protein ACYSX0_21265, partial [Planctomycetota bacterium]